MPLVISDIDGTVNRLSPPRGKLLMEGKWDEFSEQAASDPPNPPVILILQMLAQRGYFVDLHTGRAEPVRPATEDWLWAHNVPYRRLLMRGLGDRRPNLQVKRDFLASGGYSPGLVKCIFEDRPDVADFYRSRGYVVLQVLAGAGTQRNLPDRMLPASGNDAN